VDYYGRNVKLLTIYVMLHFSASSRWTRSL